MNNKKAPIKKNAPQYSLIPSFTLEINNYKGMNYKAKENRVCERLIDVYGQSWLVSIYMMSI